MTGRPIVRCVGNAVSVVLFLLVLGTVGGVAYLANQREKQRRAAAKAYAATLGYEFDTADKEPPPIGFDLFELGHSKNVSYQVWRPGSSDSAFQYRYVTGTGKDKRTYDRSCALIEIPFTAPHLRIGPEGFWSSIGRAVGIRDIEIESPSFNDRYRVACDDERFAITLLDHDVVAWMLSPMSGGGSVRFELGGRWMLCWGDRVDWTQLFGFVEWAQGARTKLPDVLTSLYPPP